MRIVVHQRAAPFGVRLHLPAQVPLALIARPAAVIAAALIGVRGEAGAAGLQGVGTQDDPGDLTLFFNNGLV